MRDLPDPLPPALAGQHVGHEVRRVLRDVVVGDPEVRARRVMDHRLREERHKAVGV